LERLPVFFVGTRYIGGWWEKGYYFSTFYTMPYLGALLLIGFVIWVFMVKPRVKKKRVKTDRVGGSGVSDGERKILEDTVAFYRKLSVEDKGRFEKDVVSFLDSCIVTGVGFELSDTDRMLVAASAVIPIFGFPNWMYRNLNEVLLYPNSFNGQYETQGEDRSIAGMVGWGAMNRTMILSRQSLHEGFENEHSKSNVGIHEFVHLIDKSDAAVDGIPESIMQKQYIIPWLKLMHEEIREIRERHSDINPYGATNESEFLSVVSEYFFNQPELLERKHPELYAALERMFRQDPAE